MTGQTGQIDERAMERCLALARRAEGRTAPNPMVGAVVLREGQVVGEGWHARAGEAHAEVAALRVAGGRAAGGTLVVNLEPCDHFGRTPPCTEAILGAGIRRVVVGTEDPNPRVDGRGVRRLRAAGLEVEVGVLAEACRELNRAFFTVQRWGRPWVALKAAASLDGRIATEGGESRYVSSETSRAHAHGWRDRLDAVLIGAGTALADDPALTCRIEGGRDPVPVLLDSRLRVPASARVFAAGKRALVYAAATPPADHPATVVTVARAGAGLDLSGVLADLAHRDVHSVLVEGGGQIHRAFLEAGCFDRVLLYLAPRVFCGGPGWVAGPGVARLVDSFDLAVRQITPLGPDVLLELAPRDSRSAPAGA